MELTLDQALQKGIEAHQAGQAQEADRLYTAILKAQPKHPDANHNMGVLAVGVDKVQEALPFFKTALEVNPSIAQYWLSYFDALIRLGHLDDARTVLEQARDSDADGEAFDQLDDRLEQAALAENEAPSQDQMQELMNLYNQGQLANALDQSKMLTQQYPKAFVVWNLLGAASKGLGNLAEASKAFKKVTELNPNYADGFNNLGVVLTDQGKLDEAVEVLKKALSIKPDYAGAYYNVGNALKENGEFDAAIDSYKQALKIKPDYAEAYSNMGNSLKEKGELDAAIDSYKQALKIKPDFAEAYSNMGVALQDKGELHAAIDSYKQAIRIKPDHADAYSNMGSALKDKGEFDAAIDNYKQAIRIKPEFAKVKHLLASLIGKTTKAAPRKYVEDLFDQYAAKFEHSLIENLQYQTPKIITEMIIKRHPSKALGSVLDLGCGTGLAGLELKQFCEKLDGIDLSNSMLEQARTKDVYDKLMHGDIAEYLAEADLDFDYFISTDVFIYVGELSDVFRIIKSRNSKIGKLVFSTEHREGEGFYLEKSGRYSHSKNYIEGLCIKYGYHLSHFEKTKLRKEKGEFLTGGLYLLDFDPAE